MKWGGRHANGAMSLIENSALSELLLLNICVQFNPTPNPTPPPRPNPPPPAPRRSSLQPPQVKLSNHVPPMDVSHPITCVCTKGCRYRAQPDTSSQGRVCCVSLIENNALSELLNPCVQFKQPQVPSLTPSACSVNQSSFKNLSLLLSSPNKEEQERAFYT